MKYIPHPAVQIFVWVLLALIAQHLQPLALLVMCGALLVLAMSLSGGKLLSLLQRTRWVLISLLLIYTYAIPGKSILPSLGQLSPTYDGLLDGLLQLGRLLTVLSGLAILLELLKPVQLISGLYTWAYPLRWFGLSRERVAVRLALTLQYAETAMGETASDWRAAIAGAIYPLPDVDRHTELERQAISVGDVLLLVAGIVVLIGVW